MRVPFDEDRERQEALLPSNGDVKPASLLKGKKILIVEDDNEKFFDEASACESKGAEENDIVRAWNYREAIAALKKGKFDLIFLDMEFPSKESYLTDWAGIDVLEYMISSRIIIPVLVCSGAVEKLEAMVKNIDDVEHRSLSIIKDKLSYFIEIFNPARFPIDTFDPDDSFTARVQSLLQRSMPNVEEILSIADQSCTLTNL